MSVLIPVSIVALVVTVDLLVEVEHLLVGVLCAGNKYTNSKDPFLHFMPLMYISVKTTLPYTYIYIYACCTYALVDKVIFIPFDKSLILAITLLRNNG